MTYCHSIMPYDCKYYESYYLLLYYTTINTKSYCHSIMLYDSKYYEIYYFLLYYITVNTMTYCLSTVSAQKFSHPTISHKNPC